MGMSHICKNRRQTVQLFIHRVTSQSVLHVSQLMKTLCSVVSSWEFGLKYVLFSGVRQLPWHHFVVQFHPQSLSGNQIWSTLGSRWKISGSQQKFAALGSLELFQLDNYQKHTSEVLTKWFTAKRVCRQEGKAENTLRDKQSSLSITHY